MDKIKVCIFKYRKQFLNLTVSLFIIFPAPVSSSSGSTGIPEIKAGVKPQEATVGEVIEYTVSVAGKNLEGIEISRPEKEILFPEKKDAGKKSKESDDESDDTADKIPVYIIHSAGKQDSSEGDFTYLTVKISISYYRPGNHQLPEVRITGSDRVRIAYRVPVVNIKPVNKETKFEDIEPPLDLGGNYNRVIILILAVSVITALLIFIIRLIKSRKLKKDEEVIVIPPLEKFLGELEKLQPEKLISEGKIEEYVLGISGIFRRYISSLLNFDAMEMTSDEIDRMIRRIFPGILYKKYEESFTRSFSMWDLSKFAEFTPSKEMLMDNIRGTRNLAESLWGERGNG